MKCNHRVLIGIAVLTLPLSPPSAVHSQLAEQSTTNPASNHHDDNDQPVDAAKLHNPVLWHDPGTIAALDLYDGQGGKEGQPAAPFKFESEDTRGTNPKFDARDAKGRKW